MEEGDGEIAPPRLVLSPVGGALWALWAGLPETNPTQPAVQSADWLTADLRAGSKAPPCARREDIETYWATVKSMNLAVPRAVLRETGPAAWSRTDGLPRGRARQHRCGGGNT